MTTNLKKRLGRLEDWREEQFNAARAIIAGGRLPILQQALICLEVLYEVTAERNDPEATASAASDVQRLRAHIESGKSDPAFEQECRELIQAILDDFREMDAARRRQMIAENELRGMATK